MPAYWMISNRTVKQNAFGVERAPEPTYWIADKGPLDNFKNWKPCSIDDFKALLIGAADKFPLLDQGENEEQSHVSFFVHGYNNGWRTRQSAIRNCASF
jgi:hypothetical protein